MNIEKSKAIQLTDILKKIGAKEKRDNGKEKWYFSPFRQENSASFHIEKQKNIWYDFGESAGGDAVEFVRYYLKQSGESDTVPDALRWLDNMFPVISPALVSTTQDSKIEDSSLAIKSIKNIERFALKNYLRSRGISQAIADKYLVELKLHNEKKNTNFFALGFVNLSKGYEFRNQRIQGCVRNKHISFIRGTNPDQKILHVYEGFMDFLSVLEKLKTKKLPNDTIVLNSTSCLVKAIAYIKGYDYEKLYSWMDNDDAGNKATTALKEFCKTQEGLLFVPMNASYKEHKDMNEWHMHHLGLKG